MIQMRRLQVQSNERRLLFYILQTTFLCSFSYSACFFFPHSGVHPILVHITSGTSRRPTSTSQCRIDCLHLTTNPSSQYQAASSIITGTSWQVPFFLMIFDLTMAPSFYCIGVDAKNGKSQGPGRKAVVFTVPCECPPRYSHNQTPSHWCLVVIHTPPLLTLTMLLPILTFSPLTLTTHLLTLTYPRPRSQYSCSHPHTTLDS
ncbi:hypothetical protein F5880DRAFT_260539 [Lentinula raphanica]|nr:hypothetical protein F5880DRAFT_260539 [Lentinula raphanica]